MRITRSSDTVATAMDPEHFTGPATRRALGEMEKPAALVIVASFEPGTQTHWHRHSDGQVLYVLSGAGRICTRGGDAVDIGPGDFVHAPPGEEHWHGASDTEPMSHVALSFGVTDWLERSDG
jgi:quercetin dioxygenase-like cupin family protein